MKLSRRQLRQLINESLIQESWYGSRRERIRQKHMAEDPDSERSYQRYRYTPSVPATTEKPPVQINTSLEDLPILGPKDGSFEAKLGFGEELNAAWEKSGEDPYFFRTKTGYTAVYFGPKFNPSNSYHLSSTDAKVYLNAGIELIYFDKGDNEVVSNMMTRFAR